MQRRHFLSLASAAALSACVKPEPEVTRAAPVAPPPPVPDFYAALTDEPHPVPAIPPGVVDPRLWRQEVDAPPYDAVPGEIIVDPDNGYLYLMQEGRRALRYGVGVGAAGFAWDGKAQVQFTRAWPRWTPPATMIARHPEYEPYSAANGGMPGGPDNPLGARALYLFQDGRDTLYRIHGACEPEYLGMAVSAGCVRMLDQDVIHLAGVVRHHAPVTVLPSHGPGAGALY